MMSLCIAKYDPMSGQANRHSGYYKGSCQRVCPPIHLGKTSGCSGSALVCVTLRVHPSDRRKSII